MDLLDFKIGTKLTLDIYDDLGDLIEREFVSQFEEANDAIEAYIAVPIVEGVIFAVRVGWKITVYMQEGNNIYRFFARVTERTRVDGRSIMRIRRLSDIDVAQRRQYYRFKCSVPLKYRIVADTKKTQDIPFISGTVADISGSGLCFNSSEELPIGSLIECVLDIEPKQVLLIGKIARCVVKKTDDSDQMFNHEVGILFSEIEERNRELIVRFIFNEERRQISKRLE
jgi:c-di-GMP-binding flagellar brake protein YcgR